MRSYQNTTKLRVAIKFNCIFTQRRKVIKEKKQGQKSFGFFLFSTPFLSYIMI